MQNTRTEPSVSRQPPTGLELMTAIATGAVPPPSVQRGIGFDLVEVGDGHARFDLAVDPERHLNPMGTLHGGVLCDIGDAAMGCAVATTLEAGVSYSTVELKANFFKPIRRGRLRAEGSVVRRTRKLAFAEAAVFDESGSLVAKLSSSCMILTGEDARGR